jgi:hypothetical protein
MQSDEKIHGREIGRAVTMALNGRTTRARADDINQSSGGWPDDPTAAMMQLYEDVAETTRQGLKSGYGHLEVDIAVTADTGKPPIAAATARYKGEFRGGKSPMLGAGDTLVSIATKTCGHESCAKAIWDADTHCRGSQCKVIPAGFGIELPPIRVPEWKTAPKETLPGGATSRAVRILYPAIGFEVASKKVETFVFDAGIGTVEITLELEGTLKAQKKGTMDASFSLRSYETEITQNLGP